MLTFLLNILSIKPDVNDFLLTSIADVFARHYALLGMIAKTPKRTDLHGFRKILR